MSCNSSCSHRTNSNSSCWSDESAVHDQEQISPDTQPDTRDYEKDFGRHLATEKMVMPFSVTTGTAGDGDGDGLLNECLRDEDVRELVLMAVNMSFSSDGKPLDKDDESRSVEGNKSPSSNSMISPSSNGTASCVDDQCCTTEEAPMFASESPHPPSDGSISAEVGSKYGNSSGGMSQFSSTDNDWPAFAETVETLSDDCTRTLSDGGQTTTSLSRMCSPHRFKTVSTDEEQLADGDIAKQHNTCDSSTLVSPLEFVKLLLPVTAEKTRHVSVDSAPSIPLDTIQSTADESSDMPPQTSPAQTSEENMFSADGPEVCSSRLSLPSFQSPKGEVRLVVERGRTLFKRAATKEFRRDCAKRSRKPPRGANYISSGKVQSHSSDVNSVFSKSNNCESLDVSNLKCENSELESQDTAINTTSATTPSNSPVCIVKRTIVLARIRPANTIDSHSQNVLLCRCKSQTSINSPCIKPKRRIALKIGCWQKHDEVLSKENHKVHSVRKADLQNDDYSTAAVRTGSHRKRGIDKPPDAGLISHNQNEEEMFSDGTSVISTDIVIPVTSKQLHCQEIRKKRKQIKNSDNCQNLSFSTKSLCPVLGYNSETSLDSKSAHTKPQVLHQTKCATFCSPNQITQDFRRELFRSSRLSNTKSVSTSVSGNHSLEPHKINSYHCDICTKVGHGADTCDNCPGITSYIDAKNLCSDSKGDGTSSETLYDPENPLYCSKNPCRNESKMARFNPHSARKAPKPIKMPVSLGSKSARMINYGRLAKSKMSLSLPRNKTVNSVASNGYNVKTAPVTDFSNFCIELMKKHDGSNAARTAAAASLKTNTSKEDEKYNPRTRSRKESELHDVIGSVRESELTTELKVSKEEKNTVPSLNIPEPPQLCSNPLMAKSKVKIILHKTAPTREGQITAVKIPSMNTDIPSVKLECPTKKETLKEEKPLPQKPEPGTNPKRNRYGWLIPEKCASKHSTIKGKTKQNLTNKSVSTVEPKRYKKSVATVKRSLGYLKATICSDERQKTIAGQKQQRLFDSGAPSRYLLTSSTLKRNSTRSEVPGTSLSTSRTYQQQKRASTKLGKAQSLKELPCLPNNPKLGKRGTAKPLFFSDDELAVLNAGDTNVPQEKETTDEAVTGNSSALKRAIHSLRRLLPVPFWMKEQDNSEVAKVNTACSNTHLLAVFPSLSDGKSKGNGVPDNIRKLSLPEVQVTNTRVLAL